MFKELLSSLRALLALTVLTGVLYPLAMTGAAQLLFPRQANGSQVVINGKLTGSALLAQKFTTPRYFWPRPSAADYATVPSGASNQGFTSKNLLTFVTTQRASLGQDAPSDLLYASGSGLDPHISPAAAQYQVARVAQARSLPPEKVSELVRLQTEGPQFGFLGEPRVNVLLLNQALDELK